MYYRSGTAKCCYICFVCTHHMVALIYVKWSHGCHPKGMAANWKSNFINRCIFTWRTILPNFILINWNNRALRLFEEHYPNKTTQTRFKKGDMGLVSDPKKSQINKQVVDLCCGVGCKTMVFMISGINSATSLWTFCLYSWYMRTTMMGSSASTFSDISAFGIKLYWNTQRNEQTVSVIFTSTIQHTTYTIVDHLAISQSVGTMSSSKSWWVTSTLRHNVIITQSVHGTS